MRWSLDSGGWGKRGSQRRETVGKGKRNWDNIHWGKRGSQGETVERGKRNWYNILRALVKSERQEANIQLSSGTRDKSWAKGRPVRQNQKMPFQRSGSEIWRDRPHEGEGLCFHWINIDLQRQQRGRWKEVTPRPRTWEGISSLWFPSAALGGT